MPTCSCGEWAEDGRDRCARCSALLDLGLDSSATQNGIKEAYRTLVKVWHPDRFPNDARLKETADEKLKAINSAYVFLTSKAGKRPAHTAGEYPRRPAPPGTRPAKSPFVARLVPSPVTLLKFGVLAVGLVIGGLLVKAADAYLAAQPVTGRLYSEMRDGIVANFRAGASSLWNRTGLSLHGLVPEKAAAAPAAIEQSADAGQLQGEQISSSEHRSQNLHPRELGAARAEPMRLLPYITTGLSQAEVEAIQGAPTAATADKLVYGGSELYFTHGKLTGWKIDSASSPLRVKLWPDAPVDPDRESFRVGSSKNVVLVVQGTPTFLSEDQFGYGGSRVFFQDGRVTGWKNDPSTVPLRIAPE